MVAVLVSGSGTNLAAMIDEDVPISVVVADRTCKAIDVAKSAGIPAVLIERQSFGKAFDRDAYTQTVLEALEPFSFDLIALAGWGTILGSSIYERYPAKIINTHPALLPAFRGWHPVREALAAGVTLTGCTIHVSTPAVDEGPILAQEAVPVLENDTEDSLHERIKQVERRLYPKVIKEYLNNETT